MVNQSDPGSSMDGTSRPMDRGRTGSDDRVIAGDVTKRRAVFTAWRAADAIRAELGELCRNWANLIPESQTGGISGVSQAKLPTGGRLCRNTGQKQNAGE